MDEREVELQRARREGYVTGAFAHAWPPYNETAYRAEAKAAYPITERKPRVVTAPNGTRYRVRGEWVEYRPPGCVDWGCWGEVRSVAVMADLLANPFEDVTE